MALHIINPRTEWADCPLGIDAETPHFSWQLVSDRRGCRQTSWQITLGTGAELEHVLWDSGVVSSDAISGIAYGGPALESRTRYFWTVSVIDCFGEKADSEPVWFETGLLSAEDWQAKWIETGIPAPTKDPVTGIASLKANEFGEVEMPPMDFSAMDGGGFFGPPKTTDYSNLQPSPYFRKTFMGRDDVTRARLYATAHGVYKVWINGEEADDRLLAPEFTTYNKVMLYQTYDVTDKIAAGDNVLAFSAAEGWWSGHVGNGGMNQQFGENIGLLYQLEIDYADGNRDVVISDESTVFSTGPMIYSDIFIGEYFDARLEMTGWNRTGFDDSGWKKTVLANYDMSVLRAQFGDPVRAVRTLKAKKVDTPNGETVFDFGQVIAGFVSFKVKGPAGTKVEIEHSEMIQVDGNFFLTLTGENMDQKITYILRGDPNGETFTPHFTFQGFRYIRVKGWPGEANPEMFTAVAISSDMQQTGEFQCGNELLNQLVSNTRWSQRGNMISVPTDCPTREKQGWTGDFQVFINTACFNSDMNLFAKRWLMNLRADQCENGNIQSITPLLATMNGGVMATAGWSDACVLVPWALYQKYDDITVLEDNYDMMHRYLLQLEHLNAISVPKRVRGTDLDPATEKNLRLLWNTGMFLGDHGAASTDLLRNNGVLIGDLLCESVCSLFYCGTTALFAKIARLLGKDEDADYYSALSQKAKAAFRAEYMYPEGRMKAPFQSLYILALQFDLMPENREGLTENLMELIRENGGKHDTGFLTVPYLLDVLSNNGQQELALKFLMATTPRSWLYPVVNGATTIWESWEHKGRNGRIREGSYNHYSYGAVCDFIFRKLGGMTYSAPGGRVLTLDPVISSCVGYASTSLNTVYGQTEFRWTEQEGGVEYFVEIPAGAEAIIKIDAARATEDGAVLNDVQGVDVLDEATVKVGSGKYHFFVEKK